MRLATVAKSQVQKSQVQQSKSSEQGLTLLECLMAVVVIGLTMAMITPPLVIAAATRVQNRRAEQAMQVAQGEVDRVRAMVARDQHTVAKLPAIATVSGNLEDVSAPARPANPATPSTSSPIKSPANCGAGTYNNGEQIPVNQGLRVDVDGDCKADFFMQTFRTAGTIRSSAIIPNPNPPSDFQMGVRVYSILAAESSGSLETKSASLQIVRGEGKQRTRPLAVLYTPFSRSDQGDTLCSYHQNSERTGALSASCN
jgi:prepilin-type N-terminal cleavage/methylation domain-containing protein